MLRPVSVWAALSHCALLWPFSCVRCFPDHWHIFLCGRLVFNLIWAFKAGGAIISPSCLHFIESYCCKCEISTSSCPAKCSPQRYALHWSITNKLAPMSAAKQHISRKPLPLSTTQLCNWAAGRIYNSIKQEAISGSLLSQDDERGSTWTNSIFL